jgi:hypothetical protein
VISTIRVVAATLPFSQSKCSAMRSARRASSSCRENASAKEIRKREKGRSRCERHYNRLNAYDGQTTTDERGMHISANPQIMQNGNHHKHVSEHKYQKKKPGKPHTQVAAHHAAQRGVQQAQQPIKRP